MRCRAALAFGAAFLLAPTSESAPIVVRVRGAAKIAAAASASDGFVVLSGSVLDDTGRPVGGAPLSIRGLGADGTSVPLPALGPCTDQPPAAGFRAGGSERRAEQRASADAVGRFCVSTEASGLHALEVTFTDEHGLLDAALETVTVDLSRRAVELRALPSTPSFELERDSQRVEVSARTGPLSAMSPPVPLALYALTSTSEALIAQGACPVNGNAELDVPTSKLPGPGAIELALRFAGSSLLQPAEARRRVLATARVTLALGRAPAAADSNEGISLDVALGSAAGAVNGGSVEARLDGQTVGIAPVEHGAARVLARFASSGKSAHLELRYLPTEPWWRAGDALGVEVPLAPHGHWTSLVWWCGLAALGAWLLWGWRRPERTERPKAFGEEPHPRVAGVHVIQRDDSVGWRGVVRDAHDERPIEGALVSLVGPAPERQVHARAVADTAGHFEVWSPAAGELELVVTAPWHSDFTSSAPPHGELRIDLVSRRRHVLARLVRWAERRGPLNRGRSEPTPGDVKRHGRKARKEEIVEWATAVENAAYGPEAVDETIEHDVSRREPPEAGDRREPQR